MADFADDLGLDLEGHVGADHIEELPLSQEQVDNVPEVPAIQNKPKHKTKQKNKKKTKKTKRRVLFVQRSGRVLHRLRTRMPPPGLPDAGGTLWL